MKYKLISFYSEPETGTYYTDSADRLRRRCEELGIDYHIEHRESAGSWIRNTREKPAFILECLQRLSGPLLWVDVDSIVHSKPDLALYSDVDFAAAPFTGKSKLVPPLIIRGTTLLFNPTPAALELVKEWNKTCKLQVNENYGDHRLLSNLLHTPAPGFKWDYLPETFSRLGKSSIKPDPVISIGLAQPVESRRRAMDFLRSDIQSGKVTGKDWK
jgi:hypothetical protein